MSLSLIKPSTKIRVSSTLNKDVKNYGKHHLVDRKRETCWNSDSGLPQWIQFDFEPGKSEEQDKDILTSSENVMEFDLMGLGTSTSVENDPEQDGPIRITSISITFQGGFVGKTARILSCMDNNHWQEIGRIYPRDVNDRQSFPISYDEPLKKLRLVFDESTDFYGRVTIYDLDILG